MFLLLKHPSFQQYISLKKQNKGDPANVDTMAGLGANSELLASSR